MLHIDALSGREIFDTAEANVQPVSLDFVKVKQALMKADKLYSEVNGLTNADQTDNSMRALVRALYHHSEHYKKALNGSNDMYSTYSTWSSMYRSLMCSCHCAT
jgi:ferric iron reductase protein FhuF